MMDDGIMENEGHVREIGDKQIRGWRMRKEWKGKGGDGKANREYLIITTMIITGAL